MKKEGRREVQTEKSLFTIIKLRNPVLCKRHFTMLRMAHGQTDRQTDRLIDRQTDRYTDRHADTKTVKQTDW